LLMGRRPNADRSLGAILYRVHDEAIAIP
jgi:hypothetical protein